MHRQHEALRVLARTLETTEQTLFVRYARHAVAQAFWVGNQVRNGLGGGRRAVHVCMPRHAAPRAPSLALLRAPARRRGGRRLAHPPAAARQFAPAGCGQTQEPGTPPFISTDMLKGH